MHKRKNQRTWLPVSPKSGVLAASLSSSPAGCRGKMMHSVMIFCIAKPNWITRIIPKKQVFKYKGSGSNQCGSGLEKTRVLRDVRFYLSLETSRCTWWNSRPDNWIRLQVFLSYNWTWSFLLAGTGALSNGGVSVRLEIPHPSELMILYSPRLLALLLALKHLYEVFNWIGQRQLSKCLALLIQEVWQNQKCFFGI